MQEGDSRLRFDARARGRRRGQVDGRGRDLTVVLRPESLDAEGERERPGGHVVEAVLLLRAAAAAPLVAREARDLLALEGFVLRRVDFEQRLRDSLGRLREVYDVGARGEVARGGRRVLARV